MKAMKMRKLRPECTLVYKIVGDKKEMLDWAADSAEFANCELVVELVVDPHILSYFSTSISHNFMRKTFFSITFCDVCSKMLLQGFRCDVCAFKFHHKCAQAVPPLCQPAPAESTVLHRAPLRNRPTGSNDDSALPTASFDPNEIEDVNLNVNYYSHLLAMNRIRGETTLGPLTKKKSKKNKARASVKQKITAKTEDPEVPDTSRERSTSAPNVHLIYPTKKGNKSNAASPTVRNQYLTGSVAGAKHAQFFFGPKKGASGVEDESMRSIRARSADDPNGQRSDSRAAGKANAKRTASSGIEDWEIPEAEIVFGDRVGSGSFGTVYKGSWHGPVALKKLNVFSDQKPTQAQLQAFKNEVAVLRKTRHVNVLLFMGCVHEQLTIVTQWCEGSSLYKHLHVLETKFDVRQMIEVCRQTAQGMDYLHAKNIIHRDLKSNNIFLHEDLTVKIGDFGLATVKSRFSQIPPSLMPASSTSNSSSSSSSGSAGSAAQPTGSILWMAPEVIRMTPPSPYSFQSDVYSFGVVLFELATGQLPYRSLSKDAILFMVGSGLLRPDPTLVKPHTPKPLVRLMMDCTNFEANKRPLFRPILASLEALLQSQPMISRSMSEPVSLNRAFSKSSGCLLFGSSVTASSSESPDSDTDTNSLDNGSVESLY